MAETPTSSKKLTQERRRARQFLTFWVFHRSVSTRKKTKSFLNTIQAEFTITLKFTKSSVLSSKTKESISVEPNKQVEDLSSSRTSLWINQLATKGNKTNLSQSTKESMCSLLQAPIPPKPSNTVSINQSIILVESCAYDLNGCRSSLAEYVSIKLAK